MGPIRLWHIKTPAVSRQLGHRWRRGCQPYMPASGPLPPRKFLVLISVRGWVDPRATVQLEGLGQLKNPMTSSGIKPSTFRLVSLCLNKLQYCVPHKLWIGSYTYTEGTEHNTKAICIMKCFLSRENVFSTQKKCQKYLMTLFLHLPTPPLLTYLLMYRAEPFLRNCQLCSHSGNSQQF
jgi:hypothetical protein